MISSNIRFCQASSSPQAVQVRASSNDPATLAALAIFNVRNNPESLLTERSAHSSSAAKKAAAISPFYGAPGLGDVLRTRGDGAVFNGYRLSRAPESSTFVAGSRVHAPEREYGGDKFHISVAHDQIEYAFAELSVLLFSRDCPFDEWKLADPNITNGQGRVGAGAQVTLYADMDGAPSARAAQLTCMNAFINAVEDRLSSADVRPGDVPISDAQHSHWTFCSYRNEHSSDRTGQGWTTSMLEPMFQLVGQQEAISSPNSPG
jgi:phosphothreonine lyase